MVTATAATVGEIREVETDTDSNEEEGLVADIKDANREGMRSLTRKAVGWLMQA